MTHQKWLEKAEQIWFNNIGFVDTKEQMIRAIAQALQAADERARQEVLKAFADIDPLDATGNWEDGTLEDIAYAVHRHIIKTIQKQVGS